MALLINAVRERHGTQLSKIEAGEEGYEDVFIYACPKFIIPAVPAYEEALTKGSTCARDDAYKFQVNHLMNEMSNQQTVMKLRSYMKLYTTINIDQGTRFRGSASFIQTKDTSSGMQ
jgi:translation initiation factor 3 subunit L